MKSKKFATIEKFYNTLKADGTRIWTKTMVSNAVEKGWITTSEYEEITGEIYQPLS